MNRDERRYERVLSAAVVAAFAAFWVIQFGTNDPPEFRSQYFFSALLVAVLATLWVIAARLLWRAWWRPASARALATDGPALLLAVAVATLPDERREWGAAMPAELAQVRGRSARWWFAAGCARAAVFPPRRSWAPVFVVAVLTAVAVGTADRVVDQALPALRVFAVTFVALVGATATLAAARSHRMRATPPTVTTACIASVAACIAVTASFLIDHPAAAEYLSPAAAVVLASVLAGCMWVALAPPRGLTTSRLARAVGAAAAAALGLGFLVTSRLTINTLLGPVVWVIFAPIVVFFVASGLAAAAGRSFRAGVQTAVWTGLGGTLLVFAIGLPEASYRYGIDSRLLLDGEMGYPIGRNLGGAAWVLIAIPLLGLPFGVIGAAIGNAKWRLPHARETHEHGSQPEAPTLPARPRDARPQKRFDWTRRWFRRPRRFAQA